MKGRSRQEQSQWLKPPMSTKIPHFWQLTFYSSISSPCPLSDSLRPSKNSWISRHWWSTKCQIIQYLSHLLTVSLIKHTHWEFSSASHGMSQRHQSGGSGKALFWLLIDSVWSCLCICVSLNAQGCVNHLCSCSFWQQIKHNARPFLPNTLYLSNLVTHVLHLCGDNMLSSMMAEVACWLFNLGLFKEQ